MASSTETVAQFFQGFLMVSWTLILRCESFVNRNILLILRRQIQIMRELNRLPQSNWAWLFPFCVTGPKLDHVAWLLVGTLTFSIVLIYPVYLVHSQGTKCLLWKATVWSAEVSCFLSLWNMKCQSQKLSNVNWVKAFHVLVAQSWV